MYHSEEELRLLDGGQTPTRKLGFVSGFREGDEGSTACSWIIQPTI